MFSRARVVVFCDGDFWHGRDWRSRRRKLARGSNPAYWIAKIRSNIERDRRNEKCLKGLGWNVIRVWESEVMKEPEQVAASIQRQLGASPRMETKR